MSDLKTQSQGGTQTLEQGSLLDEILNEGKIKPSEEGYDVVRRGVQHFIAEMLAPGRAAERVDKNIVDAMIAEIDSRLSAQINAIIHHRFCRRNTIWRKVLFEATHMSGE